MYFKYMFNDMSAMHGAEMKYMSTTPMIAPFGPAANCCATVPTKPKVYLMFATVQYLNLTVLILHACLACA